MYIAPFMWDSRVGSSFVQCCETDRKTDRVDDYYLLLSTILESAAWLK